MNRVIRAIALWKQRPFEYGSTDCCQFCDFVVHELTGVHRIPWRYSTEEQVVEILTRRGSLGGAVDFCLGKPAKTIAPGNVCLWTIMGLTGIGIAVSASHVAVIDASSGRLHEISADFVDRSWSCQG